MLDYGLLGPTEVSDAGRIVALGGQRQRALLCQILPPAMLGYQRYCPYTLDPGPAGVWTAPNLARLTRLSHPVLS